MQRLASSRRGHGLSRAPPLLLALLVAVALLGSVAYAGAVGEENDPNSPPPGAVDASGNPMGPPPGADASAPPPGVDPNSPPPGAADANGNPIAGASSGGAAVDASGNPVAGQAGQGASNDQGASAAGGQGGAPGDAAAASAGAAGADASGPAPAPTMPAAVIAQAEAQTESMHKAEENLEGLRHDTVNAESARFLAEEADLQAQVNADNARAAMLESNAHAKEQFIATQKQVITHEANAVKNLAAEDQVLKDTEQRIAYEKSDIKKEMADFTAAVQHSHVAQRERDSVAASFVTGAFQNVERQLSSDVAHLEGRIVSAARRQLQMASATFAADAYRSYAYNSAAAAFTPHFDDRAAMQRYRAMLANDVARAQTVLQQLTAAAAARAQQSQPHLSVVYGK